MKQIFKLFEKISKNLKKLKGIGKLSKGDRTLVKKYLKKSEDSFKDLKRFANALLSGGKQEDYKRYKGKIKAIKEQSEEMEEMLESV